MRRPESESSRMALEVLDEARRYRIETGEVALSPQYLRWVEAVEALAQNKQGADKGWVERSRRQFREHFARVSRIR